MARKANPAVVLSLSHGDGESEWSRSRIAGRGVCVRMIGLERSETERVRVHIIFSLDLYVGITYCKSFFGRHRAPSILFVPGQTACVHPISLLTLPLYILASAPGASLSPVFCQTSSCLVPAADRVVVRHIVPLRRRAFVCTWTTYPSTNVETAAAHSRHVISHRQLPSRDRDIQLCFQLGCRRRVCCWCLG
jgi:hypothetical protein